MTTQTTLDTTEILTLRVSIAPGDNIMVTCDQVRGLFIATKSFEKSMGHIGPALMLLAKAGAKVPGVNA
jgi:hypothetical protein